MKLYEEELEFLFPRNHKKVIRQMQQLSMDVKKIINQDAKKEQDIELRREEEIWQTIQIKAYASFYRTLHRSLYRAYRFEKRRIIFLYHHIKIMMGFLVTGLILLAISLISVQ